MTIDFLIGAIRASRDLHPQVKTELEEILWKTERQEGCKHAYGERTVSRGLEADCPGEKEQRWLALRGLRNAVQETR